MWPALAVAGEAPPGEPALSSAANVVGRERDDITVNAA